MNYSATTGSYLISLMKAAINESAPPPAPEGLNYNELFSLAKFHSIANIACYMLEKAGDKIPSEPASRFQEIRDKAIIADITFQMEFDALCENFRQNNIRILPLKGILLKSLYPQSDYRTMSDIDILIDAENSRKVRQTMESLGYETAEFDHGVHDVYHKPPITSIEVHRELFGTDGREFAPIFSDPWDMCPEPENRIYKLSDEAFLAFVLAHGMKHYELGGSGIRTFMDIYILMKRCGESIDMTRVFSMFESVGQLELCKKFIALSKMWFGDAETTAALSEMERYIISGGTYGTIDNRVQNALKTKSKSAYILERLFPDLMTMKQNYPVLKKVPVLLPVFWIVRMITKPFINHRQTSAKIKSLLKK